MSAVDDIEKLVEKTAKDALGGDITLQHRIDALKVLGIYYTALKKAELAAPEESDEPTIEALRAQMDEAENGHGRSTRVSNRTRSRQ